MDVWPHLVNGEIRLAVVTRNPPPPAPQAKVKVKVHSVSPDVDEMMRKVSAWMQKGAT